MKYLFSLVAVLLLAASSQATHYRARVLLVPVQTVQVGTYGVGSYGVAGSCGVNNVGADYSTGCGVQTFQSGYTPVLRSTAVYSTNVGVGVGYGVNTVGVGYGVGVRSFNVNSFHNVGFSRRVIREVRVDRFGRSRTVTVVR